MNNIQKITRTFSDVVPKLIKRTEEKVSHVPVSSFGYVKIISSPKFPLEANEISFGDFVRIFNLSTTPRA